VFLYVFLARHGWIGWLEMGARDCGKERGRRGYES